MKIKAGFLRGYGVTCWRHNTYNMKTDSNRLKNSFRLIYCKPKSGLYCSNGIKNSENRHLRGNDVTWWRHNTYMTTNLNSTQKILSIDLIDCKPKSSLYCSNGIKNGENQTLRGYDVTWWRHNTNMKTDKNPTCKILLIDVLQAYIGSILLRWQQK